MTEFDVCVVGAGFGGATVAALLAKGGLKVCLLEKTARAGGKTQTTERKGYRFEMFGAVGIPAYNSRFHELVDTLGVAERAPFVGRRVTPHRFATSTAQGSGGFVTTR